MTSRTTQELNRLRLKILRIIDKILFIPPLSDRLELPSPPSGVEDMHMQAVVFFHTTERILGWPSNLRWSVQFVVKRWLLTGRSKITLYETTDMRKWLSIWYLYENSQKFGYFPDTARVFVQRLVLRGFLRRILVDGLDMLFERKRFSEPSLKRGETLFNRICSFTI